MKKIIVQTLTMTTIALSGCSTSTLIKENYQGARSKIILDSYGGSVKAKVGMPCDSNSWKRISNNFIIESQYEVLEVPTKTPISFSRYWSERYSPKINSHLEYNDVGYQTYAKCDIKTMFYPQPGKDYYLQSYIEDNYCIFSLSEVSLSSSPKEPLKKKLTPNYIAKKEVSKKTKLPIVKCE
ncbi:hypothetical protein [Zooshikella ganghwensis]|uniref:Lipoprotein n=1 Tax=Zooshikella ganghwensis TaxID=202772 RepID=A0A4P9VQ83_9GAMM|nr:hypothetical protein [Zooshikella ganghwensis]RDH45663.1 hypothetical protein B9G39_20630 [Zooshikella ganghwensis]